MGAVQIIVWLSIAAFSAAAWGMFPRSRLRLSGD
jgi:hypothetical protein